MEYRRLGPSGMLVSEIAYGNWVPHGAIDPDAGTACVHAALDVGITTFDTADGYADSQAEVVLGAALKGHRREAVEVCTKAYFPAGPAPNDRGLSRKHVLASIEGSLRRLGMEYVDVYQAHRYDYQTPLHETMEAFADIVHAGKAHYIGVSEWKPDEIRAAALLARELKITLVSNQPQYSMLWRVIESEIQPACEALGITQMVYSPLAQGVLTGKYAPGLPPADGTRAADSAAADPAADGAGGNAVAWMAPEVRRRAYEAGRGSISSWMSPDVLRRVQLLVPVAREAGLSLAEMALAWVLGNRNVSTAIVGGSRPEQVRQNASASGIRLDADVLARIEEILDPIVERDPTRIPVYEVRP
ncbi:MAG TPA: aldo/keto reductase family protein [Trebonia sp.]|jgi:aryl-alcohol dehydrogenase-like predicted oxidoreductase|nr:aldo/keto reductase family protein [Trebonia sp.]